MEEKIDIVVLWVDGGDAEWLKEKSKYIAAGSDANSSNRYRDWNIFRYWFRGIEKYAPWINHIYLVTYGHVPKWLKINNPKLTIVKHKEIIPKEYLPTYNTNVIHYYIDGIKNLSKKYILFDDDMFVISKTVPNEFFKGDRIVDTFGEADWYYGTKSTQVYPHELLNNLQYINGKYQKRKQYIKHPFRYIHPRYGLRNNIETIINLSHKQLRDVYSPHLPQAILKKHVEIFKRDCKDEIEKSSSNKFRSKDDFTRLAIRDIAYMEGDIAPRSKKFGKRLELGVDNEEIMNTIRNKSCKILCINDSGNEDNFERIQKRLIDAFENIFPNKSSYEK